MGTAGALTRSPLPVVLMFVRQPEPGRVKTRLAADTSPEHAAALYRLMVEMLRDELLPAAGHDFQLWLYATPGKELAQVGEWLLPPPAPPAESVRLVPQPDTDLAERLEHAGRMAFAAGAPALLLIGSDCVDLRREDLREALATLRNADAVIGPATDGGFWLLGLKRWRDGLFHGVAYSHPETAAQMQARLRGEGFSVALGAERADVDRLVDLTLQPAWVIERMRRRAATSGPEIQRIIDSR